MAFWRSPHGPLGSRPPRAGYSQKERGKKRRKGKKEEREKKKKGKGNKRREEREEDLRTILAGYSVFSLCTSLSHKAFRQ